MNRRSFLKISSLGVAGAAIAIRSGTIFSVPRIIPVRTGLDAWLPEPGSDSFFGVNRFYANSSNQLAALKELYADDIAYHHSLMIVESVDRDRRIITVRAG